MGNSVLASALKAPSIHIGQFFWFVHSRFIIEVLIGHYSHLKKLFGSEMKENPCRATKTYNNDAGSVQLWELILLKGRINFKMLFKWLPGGSVIRSIYKIGLGNYLLFLREFNVKAMTITAKTTPITTTTEIIVIIWLVDVVVAEGSVAGEATGVELGRAGALDVGVGAIGFAVGLAVGLDTGDVEAGNGVGVDCA